MDKVKRNRMIALILIGIVAVAGLATAIGFGVAGYVTTGGRDTVGELHIAFDSSVLMLRGDSIVAPASGVTRRSVRAQITRNGEVQESEEIEYRILQSVEGVRLEGDMLIVSADLPRNRTFTVEARSVSQPRLYTTQKVSVVRDDSLQDVPRSPLEKEGWELYYQDDFDGTDLDMTHWSPYYLRNWTDDSMRTRATYSFESDGENTSLVLTADQDRNSWSAQDAKVKVCGISSYETDYLHKFGTLGSGAVFNTTTPDFDGLATKYGYFELRMRMPDTRDGSHFAWWMIGVQDDMHEDAMLQGDSVPMQSHYSNETGEIDIIETTLSSLKGMKQWRPVIHPNGTTDYQYHWVEAAHIPGNPMLEYHNYGFEWDETGVKFYVDGNLVSQSDRSPNYRMMTFLTLYATGGIGEDRGIYPKQAYIDYLRIYKRADRAGQPANVVIRSDQTPEDIAIPDSGQTQIALQAYATDEMDRPVDSADVQWRLSGTIDGFTPTSSPSVAVAGVQLRSDGVLTVSEHAIDGQDVFVTAYVNDRVKQTKHIRLTKQGRTDSRVLFDLHRNGLSLRNNSALVQIARGETLQCTAQLYDNFLQPRSDVKVSYRLSADIAGKQTVSYQGVTLRADGSLTIDKDCPLPAGSVLIVTAQAGNRYANLIVRVQ